MTGQYHRWAFTRWLGEGDNAGAIEEDMKCVFGEKCSRWVFQLERGGESGRLHFQGRVSFKAKFRLTEIARKYPGYHWSIEHDERGSDFYCMKSQTREAGPWSDQDAKHPIPWDLAAIKDWHPWQLDLFESFKRRCDRNVNVLVDPVGGIGKSKVLKMAVWKKWAFVLPPIGDSKDMIQAVASMVTTAGPRPAFVVDLPRMGEGDTHMRSIYKTIEQVKNGLVFDLRYKYTEAVFGSPQVWVFTNERPKADWLSRDRWRYWAVEGGQLLPTP